MPNRKPYPSDVSDEEWAFVAPYLTLVREDAPQRTHDLREVLNGLRWVVRTGSPWRYMPYDLPPWEAVYQQTRRWLSAGVFEAMVHDLRVLLRLSELRASKPTAAILDSRTVGVRGPGLCRGTSGRRSGGSWHPSGGGQAPGGQTRLRATTTPLGRGTRFRMGIAVSAPIQRLREATHHFGRAALRRFRMPLSPPSHRCTWVESIIPSRSVALDDQRNDARAYQCSGPQEIHVEPGALEDHQP